MARCEVSTGICAVCKGRIPRRAHAVAVCSRACLLVLEDAKLARRQRRRAAQDKSGLDAIYELGRVVREERVKAGLTVDTVEWLTELYEGRGYSHEDALKLARGEELP